MLEVVKSLSSSEPIFISFISASGGVGKTKLALILAYYLQKEKHKKVLFIDLDPTGGASFSVFDDEELEAHLRNNVSFSAMIKHSNEGRNIDFDDYKISAKLSDIYVDFVIPGDDLVDIIERFWKGGSAGPTFAEKLREIIPLNRYDYVIVDTAPFFDPRYTTLSVYLSDYQIIPVTPSVVDMRRNIMMLKKIRNDVKMAIRFKGISSDLENFMKERYIVILNKIPVRSNQAEHLFYKHYIFSEKLPPNIGALTKRRIEKLVEYMNKLSTSTKILRAGIKLIDRTIGRFPKEASGRDAVESTMDYLIKIYEIIKRK